MLILLGDECVMSSRFVSLSADWVLGLGSHVGDYDVAAGDDGDEGDDDKNGDDGDDDDVLMMMKIKVMVMRVVMRGWG